MKLNVIAAALTTALIWGVGVMFLVGLANLLWPGYAREFLALMASIYPGYKATPCFGQVLIGAGYGLVDGLVGGAVFAWLYNVLAAKCGAKQQGS